MTLVNLEQLHKNGVVSVSDVALRELLHQSLRTCEIIQIPERCGKSRTTSRKNLSSVEPPIPDSLTPWQPELPDTTPEELLPSSGVPLGLTSPVCVLGRVRTYNE